VFSFSYAATKYGFLDQCTKTRFSGIVLFVERKDDALHSISLRLLNEAQAELTEKLPITGMCLAHIGWRSVSFADFMCE
jgi:hypothetical protein